MAQGGRRLANGLRRVEEGYVQASTLNTGRRDASAGMELGEADFRSIKLREEEDVGAVASSIGPEDGEEHSLVERDQPSIPHEVQEITAAHRAWLAQCSPIFVQCACDVDHGYPFLRLFVEFVDGPDPGETTCKLITVFQGEGSFRRTAPTKHNHFATFWYRSYNRLLWKRTADINYLDVRGVQVQSRPNSVSPTSEPWRSVYTTDYAGEQTFSQGDKLNCGTWLSLVHHYTVDLPASRWERRGHRPIVYLSTANHLMHEEDANPALSKVVWDSYPISLGGKFEAEQYARQCVQEKLNLFTFMPWTRPGRVFGPKVVPGRAGQDVGNVFE